MSRFWTPWRPKSEKPVEPEKPDVFTILVKHHLTSFDFLAAFAQAVLEKYPDLRETKVLHDFFERYDAVREEIENGKGK